MKTSRDLIQLQVNNMSSQHKAFLETEAGSEARDRQPAVDVVVRVSVRRPDPLRAVRDVPKPTVVDLAHLAIHIAPRRGAIRPVLGRRGPLNAHARRFVLECEDGHFNNRGGDAPSELTAESSNVPVSQPSAGRSPCHPLLTCEPSPSDVTDPW